jgi:hypothetical protein
MTTKPAYYEVLANDLNDYFAKTKSDPGSRTWDRFLTDYPNSYNALVRESIDHRVSSDFFQYVKAGSWEELKSTIGGVPDRGGAPKVFEANTLLFADRAQNARAANPNERGTTSESEIVRQALKEYLDVVGGTITSAELSGIKGKTDNSGRPLGIGDLLGSKANNSQHIASERFLNIINEKPGRATLLSEIMVNTINHTPQGHAWYPVVNYIKEMAPGRPDLYPTLITGLATRTVAATETVSQTSPSGNWLTAIKEFANSAKDNNITLKEMEAVAAKVGMSAQQLAEEMQNNLTARAAWYAGLEALRAIGAIDSKTFQRARDWLDPSKTIWDVVRGSVNTEQGMASVEPPAADRYSAALAAGGFDLAGFAGVTGGHSVGKPNNTGVALTGEPQRTSTISM